MSYVEHGALLLDTHIFLWVLAGAPELQDSALTRRIEDASEAGLLRLSVMSLWEMAALEQAGRIRLSVPTREFIDQVTDTPGLAVLPLEREIALEAAALPGDLGGDLVDRIIVATARARALTVASADARFARYHRQGYIRLISP